MRGWEPDACNLGTCWIEWIRAHPRAPGDLRRTCSASRTAGIEQIGQSWLKHGFGALDGDGCRHLRRATQAFDHLGVHCPDPYDAEHQRRPAPDWAPRSGRRSPIPGPIPTRIPGSTPSGNVPSSSACRFTTPISIRRRTPSASSTLVEDPVRHPPTTPGRRTDPRQRLLPPGPASAPPPTTCRSWGRPSAARRESAPGRRPIPRSWRPTSSSEGLMILAAKATPLGGGAYRYEYALQNVTSHRAGRSFSVPLPQAPS